MNDSKTCPLLGAGPLGVNTNCKGERCAWWDGHHCAMLSIARSLDGLNEHGIIVWPEKEADA